VRRGGAGDGKLARAIDTIRRSAQLIAELVDKARVTSGKLALELSPISLPTFPERGVDGAASRRSLLQLEDSAPLAVAPSSDGVPEGALCGLNLLVVEDDDDGREVIEVALEDSGARVRAVSTATAALDALSGGTFDVLVSDIGLPALDGYALIARVRSSAGARLPAIALTAYVSRDDRERSLAAGFDAHIPKPVEPRTLVAAVAALAHRA
jgi:CheY-like chemotaxis protein